MPCLTVPFPPIPTPPVPFSLPAIPLPVLPALGLCCRIPYPYPPVFPPLPELPFPPGVAEILAAQLAIFRGYIDLLPIDCPRNGPPA